MHSLFERIDICIKMNTTNVYMLHKYWISVCLLNLFFFYYYTTWQIFFEKRKNYDKNVKLIV